MIDANSQFFAILTNVGMAKQANADALGIPWQISQMGVGDANGTEPIPSAAQTKLINEWRRKPLNQLRIDPVNPAVVIAEQVIPADEGGKWIREIGLYDADGDLVAVANCAPSFKPLLSQGSGRTQIVRMNFIVTNSGNITLKIDPSVVLATRGYVDAVIIDVLPQNKKAGTYTKVVVNDRGVFQSGSNPTTLAGYGITNALAVGDYGLGGFALEAASIDSKDLRGGFYYFGDGPTSFANYVGLLNLPYSTPGFSGQLGFVQGGADVKIVVRSVTNAGEWTSTRTLWHDGNFNPNDKANKANTLAGYGVTFASQTEAETGENTNKPMSALRVFQAIAAKVVQATESVLGVAKAATQSQTNSGVDDTTFITPKKFSAGIAALIIQATESIAGIARVSTQPQTDAGADDTTFVTPKKLRWGFQILKAPIGYIVFPSWLGGFVIQWGTTASVLNGTVGTTSINVPFPVSFPTQCYCVLDSYNGTAKPISSAASSGSATVGGFTMFFQNTDASQGVGGKWVAFGI